MHPSRLLSYLLPFLSPVLALPVPSIPPGTLPVHLIHEFPLQTWIENLAVRSTNGHVLTTILSAPEIYSINPFVPTPPTLIHSFSSATGVLGIAELLPDIFYVALGNYTITTDVSVAGSFGIWEVDLTHYPRHGPQVRQIVQIPEALQINGICALDSKAGLILAADANLFAVWRVNVKTGYADIAIQDPLMISTSETPGINGLHVRVEKGKKVLYYTNSETGNFIRQPITADGSPVGPSAIVLEGLEPDDFTFNPAVDAYIAENTRDQISVIRAGSGVAKLVSNVSDLAELKGPTSCAFGKTKWDKDSLYVSTCGGIPAYKSGNFTVGGSLLRIDVGRRG
jgi:hypothetical protein